MADVFLLYVREDMDRADQIAAFLRASGLEVVSEPEPAPSFFRITPHKLHSAKCVVMLWSPTSKASDITNDAFNARKRGVLVSAVIEKGSFRLSEPYADLSGWNNSRPNSDGHKLLKQLIDECISRQADQATPQLTVLPEGSSLPPTGTSRRTVRRSARVKVVSTAASKLFVCYRRDDTQDAAGRLHDHLVSTYGRDRVFLDIDSVPLGIDFVEHVAEQIGKCSAVIVMIGKQWHAIKDKKRRRRLDDEDDLVRAEIRAALQQKIPVIPVTVQNAAMPQPDDLPDDIRLLARRNGIDLSATRWMTDVERLIKELDRVMKHHVAPRSGNEAAKPPVPPSQPSHLSEVDGRSQQRVPTVFLSYPRDDAESAADAVRLHRQLAATYGRERVVPLGVPLVDSVAHQISECGAMVVMIGRQWLKMKDKRRRRRLDNPDDPVRIEIAAALRLGAPVVPLLVQNAEMPSGDELPDDIRALVRRKRISLSDIRWRTDVERLIKELDRVMKPPSGS